MKIASPALVVTICVAAVKANGNIFFRTHSGGDSTELASSELRTSRRVKTSKTSHNVDFVEEGVLCEEGAETRIRAGGGKGKGGKSGRKRVRGLRNGHVDNKESEMLLVYGRRKLGKGSSKGGYDVDSFIADVDCSDGDDSVAEEVFTAAPISEVIVEEQATPTPNAIIAQPCEEAFVYCPGRSTCFMDNEFNNGVEPIGANPWGWTISYNAVTDGVVDDCEIWMGVEGCDMTNTGKKVGVATVSHELFHYCLDLNTYESNSFQLYVGECMANDGGEQYRSDGSCEQVNVAKFARAVTTFPLVATGGPMVDTYTFDRDDPITSVWGSYTVFPVGISQAEYIVAHVEVCPAGQTHSPTISPALEQPYFEEQGTEAPSQQPAISPTSFEQDGEACVTGFVYCPERSECFTDINNPSDAWGWSIEYSAADEIVDNCEIYIGGKTACDLSSATLVGTFTMDHSFAHYCLDLDKYVSNSFHFYSGECRSNDGGDHLYGVDGCNSGLMSLYADQYGTYPLVSENGPFVSTFTFDENDKAAAGSIWSSENYQVFPIGSNKRRFFSAHLSVCPIEEEDALQDPPPVMPPVPEEAFLPTEPPTTIAPSHEPPVSPPVVPPVPEELAPVYPPMSPPTNPPVTIPGEEELVDNACYICGDKSCEVTKPDVLVPLPLSLFPFPALSCGQIDSFSRQGVVPAESCALAKNVTFQAMCGCDCSSANEPAVPPVEEERPESEPIFEGQGGDCDSAFVFCPERSTCFTDTSYNSNMPAVGADNWGWSIQYNPITDGVVEDCLILTGAKDCDLNTATVVGNFTITPNWVHYCFDGYGYESNSFQFYIGDCEGNDNGMHFETGGCKPENVAQYALALETYPLFANGGPMETTFTFDHGDLIAEDATTSWGMFQAFPIPAKDQYISAHTCVVPETR